MDSVPISDIRNALGALGTALGGYTHPVTAQGGGGAMSAATAPGAALSASQMVAGNANGAAIQSNMNYRFLHTILDPQAGDVAPPDDSGRNFTIQKVVNYGNFKVDDSKMGAGYSSLGGGGANQTLFIGGVINEAYNPVYNVIPTSSGMVLYNLFRGSNNVCVRYGFIQRNSEIDFALTTGNLATGMPPIAPATRPVISGTTGDPDGSDRPELWYIPSAYVSTNVNVKAFLPHPIQSLVFNYELAVPYNSSVKGDKITISPDLAPRFNAIVPFAIAGELRSATVPAGNRDLNGNISSAAIAATPDIASTDQGAYSPVNMATSSVTSKDYVLDVKGEEGTVCIQGPDVQKDFLPADQSRTDTLARIWAPPIDGNTGLTTYGNADGVGSIDLGAGAVSGVVLPGDGVGMGIWWVSPWNISAKENPNNGLGVGGNYWPAGTTIHHIKIANPEIGERDVYDIDFQTSVYASGHTGNDATQEKRGDVVLIATHFFCTATSLNNRLKWRSVNEMQTVCTWSSLDGGALAVDMNRGDTGGAPALQTFKFRPKVYTGSPSDLSGGKYIGTLIQQVFRMTGAYQAVPVAGETLNLFQTQHPQIVVGARTIMAQGSLGPVRIQRWDNMTTDQIVNFRATQAVMAIANAALAPYVMTAQMMASQSLNTNTMLWLQLLFKSATSPLARVYRSSVYAEMLKDFFRIAGGLSDETVARWSSGEPVLIGSAHAAGMPQAGGFFGSLGSLIGTAFGGPVGTILGTAAGGLADHVFGADGEFGDSGGEFGDAGGRFGRCGRRRYRHHRDY